ncbi:hypothetical protein [Nannocystis pusilla]|uniref:hypothetical protein n=1 Tax=Nannocystis pusilla TaxID=889268 RepID=UPI003B7C52CD
MPELAQRLAEFAAHVGALAGDEHDARDFCERLFRAFGWPDLHTAGAEFDAPTRLAWGRTLLLELHPRGTALAGQSRRLFEHWQYHTSHPRYVALCDFTELLCMTSPRRSGSRSTASSSPTCRAITPP